MDKASFAFAGVEASFRFRTDPTCDMAAPRERRKKHTACTVSWNLEPLEANLEVDTKLSRTGLELTYNKRNLQYGRINECKKEALICFEVKM